MARDAERQRLQPAAERVGGMRVDDGADHATDLFDRREKSRRSGHHAAGYVAVAVEVLGRALHREIDAERQRLLVDRARERVVDDGQNTASATRIRQTTDV